MESILQDVRYAFRMLAKSPGFTTVAVLTLALGIGANTAIFTLINAVILKMLPVRDVQRLVVIGDPTLAHNRSHGTPQTDIFSYPLYKEIRDHNNVFEDVLAAGEIHRVRTADASGKSISDEVVGSLVTGNYFSLLGVNPYIGRTLTPDDDKVEGGHPIAVISYSMFRSRFNSDPSIVGTTLRFNEYPLTVVGVAPPGFHGQVVGDVQEVWIPMMMQSQVLRGRKWLDDPESSWLTLMARLKPGVSVSQAKANLNVVLQQALNGSFGARLRQNDLVEVKKHPIDVVPGARGMSVLRGSFAKPLMLLMGIVGLVLLIACVNVANLLLARAKVRQREMAVRLAIGAKPSRVVSQLLTESVLLAFLGGGLGLLFAFWGTQLLLRLFGVTVASTGLQITPDLRVLAFTASVCLLTGILFGLVPALRSLKVDVNSALKGGVSAGESGTRGGFQWGKLLVAAQVALSVLVLFAAGLLIRSLKNLENVQLGFSRDHLLLVRVDPITAGYETPAASTQVADELQRRLERMPGVKQVAISESGLFSGSDSDSSINVENFVPANEDQKQASWDKISPGFFSALSIPVIEGREFGAQDTASSTRVAVVNQQFVNFFFHGQDPMGRHFAIDDPKYVDKPMQIVGVVRDVRHQSLEKPIPPMFYRPISQTDEALGLMQIAIRTAVNPDAMTETARAEIKSFNSGLPISSIKTMDYLVDSTISNEITIAKLSTFFGALALALACIGLYGVMAYTVAGRTREIGVRMALGAQRGNVLTLVMRESMLLVGVGICIGVPLAILCTRLINSMLFGLQNTDPLSLVVVVAILAAVGVLASMIPARRATKVDPMVALRYE
ncbi:MAG: ABC transporter permease [Terriglobales bacterium]|jgi:predicted permease